jgi:LCP family protein required for cell wall assembly
VARLSLAEDTHRPWGPNGGHGGGRYRRDYTSKDFDDWHESKAKSPRWLKMMTIVGAILIVISGGGLALMYGLAARYENKVGREDILEGVPQAEANEFGMNFLMLGSDSRADQETQSLDETGSRSDTIMIVHIKADNSGAFIVSIPRDSYVDIPAGGDWPGGKNKINAALAFGGANLAAKTIYNLTQLPLHGAMLVNFDGVQKMVEAVGGVNVCTPFEVDSIHTDNFWSKGCHDMSPAEAQDFMRQRNVPGGDLGRIKSQQNVIKGLMKKATTTGVLTNPGKLDSLLSTAAESLTVDKNMNLRDLAFALKGIPPENVKFATTPALGTMTTDAGSSVELDEAGLKALFTAVREDKTDEWLAANPQSDIASI